MRSLRPSADIAESKAILKVSTRVNTIHAQSSLGSNGQAVSMYQGPIFELGAVRPAPKIPYIVTSNERFKRLPHEALLIGQGMRVGVIHSRSLFSIQMHRPLPPGNMILQR